MTEHGTRLQSFDEPAFAALRRTDLPSFLVGLADNRILVATPPCESLGVRQDTPAPLSVRVITREMSGTVGHPPRLERIRLPNAFVPRAFLCATLPSPHGPVVLFSDPASVQEQETTIPGRQTETVTPGASAPAVPAAPTRPVRFTWETDSEGRITAISASLRQGLPGASAWHGHTLTELEADGALRGTGAAVTGLSAGMTFSHAAFQTGGAAPCKVEVGGVPLFDGMKQRIGWRGFGLLWPPSTDADETIVPAMHPSLGPNVVPLRGSNLSPRERSAFDEIARTLSDAIDGWPKPDLPRPSSSELPLSAPQGSPLQPPARTPGPERPEEPAPPAGQAELPATSCPAGAPAADDADDHAHARNEPAPTPIPAISPKDPASIPQGAMWEESLLDRLPLGLAVQQDGAIVFLNETLLAWLALETLAAFNQAGGFGAVLTRDAPEDALCLRTVSGPAPVDVRLIKATWQGAPAVIHVVRLVDEAGAAPARAGIRMSEDAAAARQAALDLFAFPVVVLDGAGSMLQANAATADLSGFPVPDLYGEPFTLLFAPESQRDAVALLDATLAGDEAPAPRMLVARAKAGRRQTVEVSASRPSGDPQRVCLAVRLVAEPAATDGQGIPGPLIPASPAPEGIHVLSEDAIGQFARRVSHGVRSPLTGILGFVESVRASTFGPVGNTRYSRQAEVAAHAAHQLLSTLEDIESLAHPLTPDLVERADVAMLMASAIDHVTPAMKRRRQIIRSDVAAGLVAQINREVLAFLLRSVLEEAVRSTPSAGQIMVSTTRTEPSEGPRRVCVLIRDSGPALTEPQIAQALSPFHPAVASDRFSSSGRPFRMARLAAVLKANGGEMRLRRGVETGMLCELHLPG